ncbi:MAG: formate--tetrahydrofolate ligase, partial [Pseudomonadota bacterium]
SILTAKTTEKKKDILMSRLIVIDACVAINIRQPPNATETSLAAYNLLESIFTICHKVAFPPAIEDEWPSADWPSDYRLSSDFGLSSRAWLARMMLAHKVVDSDIPEISDLRAAIQEKTAKCENTKAKMLEGDPQYNDYATMMVKTHLSLTHDPTLKGVPKGWTLPIRDVLIYSGAKFLCPCAGTISLMPGTSSNPAFRRVDVDVKTGKVSGLF